MITQNTLSRRARTSVYAAASVACLALAPIARGTPIGNPNAGNGWSTTSAVSVLAHSGEAPGREITHLIDGGGISGVNGEQSALAAGADGFSVFGMSRTGGANASAPNPGTLEGTGSHWFELQFDQIYSLNDVAIWNDNQQTYDQGWKHLAIQVSTIGGTSASNWTTVFNGILPQSPGSGDGATPAHFGTTLPAAVLQLGGVQARYVSFINTGLGDEASYLKQHNNLSDPNNADLSEVRFNSGLTAGKPPPSFEAAAFFNAGKSAFFDYNHDGRVDVAADGQLYKNNGGTFSAGPVLTGAAAWGDYDKDGYVDAFDYTNQKLYRNNKNGTFSVVATPNIGPMVSRGAVWGDFNRDGYLDLYVGGFEADDQSAYYRDRILTNNRNGTFSVTWTQPNDTLTSPGWPRPARGVTACDWDRDGDLDIYVSNYRLEPNTLLRNNGSGVFTDVATSHNALATSPGYYGGHSIGSVWGDFNNDGLFDLFAGNFAHAGQPESRFLKNRGAAADYAFQDMGTCGVFYQESYGTPTAGDIDNDGDLDLFFTTVYPGDSSILFRNDGNFTFTDVTTAWGLTKDGTAPTYQAAFADYGNDGYLDLFTNGILYRNTGGSNHWLKINMDGGGVLDATAIGAQVLIPLNGQTMVRQVEGAVGEGNQNDSTLHFGLGTSTGPLTLEVRWPDGTIQYVTVANVDRTITLTRTGVVTSNWISASGDWNDPSNWNAGVPSASGAVANLAGIGSGSQTLSCNSPITLSGLEFSGPVSCIVAGSGSLSIATSSGSGSISVLQASPRINLPVTFVNNTNVNIANGATLTLGGATTIKSGKTITKTGNLSIQGPLTIEFVGALVLSSGPTTILGAPSMAAGAKIDVKNTSLTISYLGQASPVETIKAQLASGYASGNWNGGGINTSSAIAGQTALGWKDDAVSRSILIKYTYYGDANLDGQVDISDLGALATAWQTSAVWSRGDFDYSGFVDISDLGKLATNWQLGVGNPLGPSFDEALASVGLAGVSVPEPATGGVSLMVLAAIAGFRRRRPKPPAEGTGAADRASV